MNRETFPAVSAFLINGIVFGSLFLAILFLNSFSEPAYTQETGEIPGGYISTVLQTYYVHEANYQWKNESDLPLVQKVPDIYAFAREHNKLSFKRGAKARFYMKEKGNEWRGAAPSLFISHAGKRTRIGDENGTFQLPDKKGNYLFEAIVEAEEGSIQYIAELTIL